MRFPPLVFVFYPPPLDSCTQSCERTVRNAGTHFHGEGEGGKPLSYGTTCLYVCNVCTLVCRCVQIHTLKSYLLRKKGRGEVCVYTAIELFNVIVSSIFVAYFLFLFLFKEKRFQLVTFNTFAYDDISCWNNFNEL